MKREHSSILYGSLAFPDNDQFSVGKSVLLAMLMTFVCSNLITRKADYSGERSADKSMAFLLGSPSTHH